MNLRLADGRSGFADFTTTGSTPFVLAARTGDLPLVRTLLDLKADPSITNADESTALLAAAGVGDLGSGQQSAGSEEEAIEVAKLLLELGADFNAVDENGETAVWVLEATGLRGLQGNGVTEDMVAPGTNISVRCHRLRDGANGCLLGFLTPEGGEELEWG